MTVPTIVLLLFGGVVSDRHEPPRGDARGRRRARRRCSRLLGVLSLTAAARSCGR